MPADRRRRIPVADGNLHLKMGETHRFGECGDCGQALVLAWNGDAGEVTIGHDYPICTTWLGRGVITASKRGAAGQVSCP